MAADPDIVGVAEFVGNKVEVNLLAKISSA
jgi:hypothetical protein